MHDGPFADAARPTRCVILRLLLKDYSLGHELLLLQQRNPLLFAKEAFDNLEPAQQRAAIIRAVLICSQTWEQNQNPHRWLGLWGWLIRKADFSLAIADFRNYRTAGALFPPMPTEEAVAVTTGEEKKGRWLGAPLLSQLYTFLCTLPDREMKPHGSTAFDFPLGFATYLFFSHLETEGALKIENAKEAEVREEMEKILSDIAREKGAKCPA